MIDLETMPTADVAAIANAALTELTRRAGGIEAAVPVALQLDLLPQDDPIDPANIDWNERLPSGRPRYMKRKDAAAELRFSIDKIKTLIRKTGSGFQFGSTWFVDLKRLYATVKV